MKTILVIAKRDSFEHELLSIKLQVLENLLENPQSALKESIHSFC